MKKKLFALFLATILIVASVPFAGVFAQEADNFTFTVENDEVTITGYNGTSDGVLTVPDEIDGLPVTVIAENAFRNQKNITEFILPDGLKAIGQYAFRECAQLEKVEIPSGVKTIERGTFDSCEALKEVILPDKLITIGEQAFECCRSLESITIPNSVTTVKMYAFFSCYELKDVSLPDGLTLLGEKAFGQTAISNITVPKGITKLEMGVFSQCPNLEEIILADTITEIGEYAFGESSSFKTINYYGNEELWAEVEKSESANDILFGAKVNFNYTNKGDIDRSYKIDSADALLVLQTATGLTTLDSNQLSAGDVTGDKVINSSDALHILLYITGNIDSFPATAVTGAEYEDEYYIYKYNNYFNGVAWVEDADQNGWGVRVKDTSLTSYSDMANVISAKPVVKATCAYSECINMVTAPKLSSYLTSLEKTFSGCTSLTTAPVIPESVSTLDSTFAGCISLTGTVIIPLSILDMTDCFIGTEKEITMEYHPACEAAIVYEAPNNVTKTVIS